MKDTLLTETLLTYITRRQGLGLRQKLEKQIKEECNYWEIVLERVIAVICTVAKRGLAFRGTDEKFCSSQNGNFLGLLELIKLIEPMAQKVHAFVLNEVNSSGYFSLLVDWTPNLSHIDQLRVVLRYLKVNSLLELKSHTSEEMANQVLWYLGEVCKLHFSKYRGQFYDNAANISGHYKGMQQKILEEIKFVIYVSCAAIH
ncbi:zinc finger MYM-type protein 1-like [Tachypleus tridentatus]|uniref:zinc finger MYM-type protein 1-like n=1 Tax=Tachypleus tridentatus TaxID=6853 RepID=UPI003FD3269E